MRVIVQIRRYQHEVDIVRFSPQATLADLVEYATGMRTPERQYLYCDEYRCVADEKLSTLDLVEGMVICDEPQRAPHPISDWVLLVSAGLDSGGMHVIPETGGFSVGRASDCDVRAQSKLISKHHFHVVREDDGLRIFDDGSANGTYVSGVCVDEEGLLVDSDAVITAGGIAFTLRHGLREQAAPRPGSLHNLTAYGTAPFNRPPRTGTGAKPGELTPPQRKEVVTPTKFNVAAVVGPVIMAGVMVVALNNVQYALFAALSPLMAVGMWAEQRLRHRRETKKERERYEQAMLEFTDAIGAQADSERLRRLDELPDPAVCVRYARLPDTRLWQCRPGSTDFLTLNAGIGKVKWEPAIHTNRELDDDVKQIVEGNTIPQSPVEVDLNDAGVIGIVGDRAAATAVARSLALQAATHCGPVDLTCVVCCDSGREQEWRWTTWLPHTKMLANSDGERWTSHSAERSSRMLHALREHIDEHPTPAMLLVVDSETLTEGRDAPARDLLGHGRIGVSSLDHDRHVMVSGIVVASSEQQLPASCNTIITVDENGEGNVKYPERAEAIKHAILTGITADTALDAARALAHFEDPEIAVTGASVPPLVKLPTLLGVDAINAENIRKLWHQGVRISTPIGVGESGPLILDLVKDGPHGLVGGTTGSGKSEFLRSLIAGLAANVPPTQLTFILVDFKGGAAFQSCERLPHTIGTLSNLDPQLADRAIRALEAEMEYRQRLFAAAGDDIDNLDAYLATNPTQPLPRLLFVVDEFAMLSKQFPNVLSSLVSVAAVGRTLGVHMILATQRPAGVVNEDILANTNLRVSLRVQSTADSSSVIGVPDAADISRNQRGRAFVKLGHNDISMIQTAWSTAPAQAERIDQLIIRPVVFGEQVAKTESPTSTTSSDTTDLDMLIDSIVQANDEEGFSPARPVWPTALGEHVPLKGFTDSSPESDQASGEMAVGGVQGSLVLFALSDDPDHQRQLPSGWDMDAGNMIVAGIPGSGTTEALSSLALTLALHDSPESLDILILDMGAGQLRPLAAMPHVIGYAGSGSVMKERRARLITYLRNELDRRKTLSEPARKLVVFIDGLATLKDEYQDFTGLELLDSLYRVWADGPDVRIWCAASTTRARMIPAAIGEVTTQKWVFRLSDPYDYSSVGIKADQAPSDIHGRCVPALSHLQTQIATPDVPLEQAVDAVVGTWPNQAPKPKVVRELPTHVHARQVSSEARFGGEPWLIPVGLRQSDLRPATIELYENEHGLIAGPARSGKSSMLLAIAQIAHETGCPTWGIGTRRSPLAHSPFFDQVAVHAEDWPAMLAQLRMHQGPSLLLIDDVERIDDPDQSLSNLVGTNLPDLHIIAAGRSDELRSMYSHWSKALRKSRCGVLLQPNPDFDGELLSVTIPRTAPVAMGCGRGYACVAGSARFIQGISPTRGDEADQAASDAARLIDPETDRQTTCHPMNDSAKVKMTLPLPPVAAVLHPPAVPEPSSTVPSSQ